MPKVVLEFEIKQTGEAVLKQVSGAVEDLTKKTAEAAKGEVAAGEASKGFSLGLSGLSAAVVAVNQGLDFAQRILGYVSRGVGALTGDYYDLGIQTRNLSFVTGESVERMSELLSAARQMDVGSQGLSKAMFLLTREVDTGGVNLAKMGIGLRDNDGRLKSASQLLSEVADKVHGYGSSQEAATELSRAFGRGVLDLLPMLRGGSAAIREATEKSAELGTRLSGPDLAAIQAYNNAWSLLAERQLAFKVSVGRDVIPVLVEVFKEFEKLRPSVVEVGRSILGIFQGVDAAALATVSGIQRALLPAAAITDALGLTKGAYADLMERATTTWTASADLASKANVNLDHYGRTAESVTNILVKQGAATKDAATVEKLLDAERLLSLQIQQRQLQAEAAAMTAGMHSADVHIAATRKLAEAKLIELQILEINDPRTRKANAALAVQITQERDRHIREIEAKDLQDRLSLQAAGVGDIEGAFAASMEAARLAGFEKIREDDAREQARRVAEADQAAAAVGDIEVAMAQGIEASRVAVNEKIRSLREGDLASARMAIAIEREELRRALDNGWISQEQYYRRVESLRLKDLELEKQTLLERLRAADSYFDKVRFGFQIQTASARDANALILQGTAQIYQQMERTVSDVYFDVVTGKWQELSKLPEQFGGAMLRALSDVLAAETVKQFTQLLSGWGGLLGSAASSIVEWLGAFQAGLWEVPGGPEGRAAIVHPGEMILPAEIAAAVRASLTGGGERGPAGRGPQSVGEAIAAAIGGRLSQGQSVAFGLAHAINTMIGLGPSLLGPSPVGMMLGMLGMATRAEAINAAGIKAAFGVTQEVATRIAADLRALSGVPATQAMFESFIAESVSTAQEAAAATAAAFGEQRAGERADFGDFGGRGGFGGVGAESGNEGASGTGGMGGSGDSSIFARGGVFDTRGPTRMVVGEAGQETVAIVRNPRRADVAGGGVRIYLSTGPIYGPGGIDGVARELVAAIRRLGYAMPGVDLFPVRQ